MFQCFCSNCFAVLRPISTEQCLWHPQGVSVVKQFSKCPPSSTNNTNSEQSEGGSGMYVILFLQQTEHSLM